jgi:hypothetical protein
MHSTLMGYVMKLAAFVLFVSFDVVRWNQWASLGRSSVFLDSSTSVGISDIDFSAGWLESKDVLCILCALSTF